MKKLANLLLKTQLFQVPKYTLHRNPGIRDFFIIPGTPGRGMASLTVAERWLDSFMGFPYFGTLFVKHETSTIYGSEKTAFIVFLEKSKV